MAYTMQQVVDRARTPLNDIDKVRWSDVELLAEANHGVKTMIRERPDLFFGNFEALPTDKALGDTLPLDDLYMQPLADYVSARAQMKEDEAAVEAKAAAFFALFRGA